MKRKHEIVLDGMDMLLLAGISHCIGDSGNSLLFYHLGMVHLAMNVAVVAGDMGSNYPGGICRFAMAPPPAALPVFSQEGAVSALRLLMRRLSEGPRTSLISWLLIGTVLLVFVGLFFSASSPSRWRWFVHMLDVRSWTLWVWAGFGAAVLARWSMSPLCSPEIGVMTRAQGFARCGLDLLLAVVAIGLGMQVFRPMLASQEDRIRPGAQVRQQYIPINNGGKFALEEINYLSTFLGAIPRTRSGHSWYSCTGPVSGEMTWSSCGRPSCPS